MNRTAWTAERWGPWIAIAALIPALPSCEGRGSAASRPPPPASGRTASEADFAGVTLTPGAEIRLGVELAAAGRRKVPRSRMLGGEARVPAGREAVLAAPVAGTVIAPPGGAARAGAAVQAGALLFNIVPLVSSDERIRLAGAIVSSGGDVEKARVELDASTIALERAESLLRGQAGSARALDDARARVDLARASLRAAETLREALAAAAGEADGGTTKGGSIAALPIASPLDGIVRLLHVVEGQKVAAGTPLAVVASLDPLWIRVPVYPGDAGRLDAEAGARLVPPGPGGAPCGPIMKLIPAPPTADPLAGTVDLFFEAPNREGALRPGERVAVRIALRGEEDALVVPWASILHDIHGGTWVYESAAPHVFRRMRVEVRAVEGDLAILESGPAPGTKVVTAGAAEIFGAELGHGK